MKATPILMSAPMVMAALDGRKTNTRRVIKTLSQLPPGCYIQPMHGRSPDGQKFGDWRQWRVVGPDYPDSKSDDIYCPYGEPGDLLWVRESFYIIGEHQGPRPGTLWTHYRADGSNNLGDPFQWKGPWKPSIHMPRWASRLTLKITDVRVERLQDISEANAIAEGLTEYFWDQENATLPHIAKEIEAGTRYWNHVILKRHRRCSVHDSAINAFRELWNDINAARGYGWDKNPWVWALYFEVIYENVDQVIKRS